MYRLHIHLMRSTMNPEKPWLYCSDKLHVAFDLLIATFHLPHYDPTLYATKLLLAVASKHCKLCHFLCLHGVVIQTWPRFATGTVYFRRDSMKQFNIIIAQVLYIIAYCIVSYMIDDLLYHSFLKVFCFYYYSYVHKFVEDKQHRYRGQNWDLSLTNMAG